MSPSVQGGSLSLDKQGSQARCGAHSFSPLSSKQHTAEIEQATSTRPSAEGFGKHRYRSGRTQGKGAFSVVSADGGFYPAAGLAHSAAQDRVRGQLHHLVAVYAEVVQAHPTPCLVVA